MTGAGADERFMAAAIRLSRNHLGLTSTNPSVACLIVKDGVVIGSAVTARGGRPHAETQALAEAGPAARGATAYVTLEPCSHHGKTPPCADALIAAGITRVVVSVPDPDERVAGRGFAMLREAGIAVETGVLEAEGRRTLAGYLMRQTKKRPHVTLKLAVSADGMIGRLGAGQIAISGPVSRGQVQVLRAESDAILVGIGTAVADDPELTVRLPGLEERSPVRIVLDALLELPPEGKLVKSAGSVPVIVAADTPPGFDNSTDPAFQVRREALIQAGVETLLCNPRDLCELLEALASRNISTLLVEGGARTAQRFLDSGLVDRIILFGAPGTIGLGGIASPCVPGRAPAGFSLRRTMQFGPDLCEEYERDN
ncbi:bifunctional diaminohydroxyphosphoribosylaminopyrimidine deaminase/5-amino-6-(5-phosphoribosylamino)uracil reductase RibD [Sinorhizobium sp. BG8]|uniref:bifunctional diaminohydroxyphosphoribosylaminopyrimidine deaminase/5-amino-6-(5-phosphoribosylamino)uracil reductase RibD n=1 Tax=Sinorhizobium sp. BG8 TaxID=2613773 RepID=UPI00193E709C|nr:bifunctional diaminohydroxyphosphoribosylaminopyrimidine deaminase/5-amino-6-(5-phosphoribosylamino)uracil reductase RibD [Sinorhizobium sp. BG8]QRM54945.1 bifunctional diaminohydroxyphosphoribosylaminopyrimidine deaminase/5-amino-6-(5-phosphoribosylamino)uracil reductase RibD [Sinorhizobium sp. BG8]